MAKKKSGAKGSTGGAASNQQDETAKRLEQPLQAVLLTEDWQGNSSSSFLVAADDVAERFQFHPLALDRPKVLSPLLNTTILDYAVQYLVAQGVQELYAVCVTEAVELYLLESLQLAHSTLKLTVIRDSTVTNSGDALRELDKRNVIQSDPFVLMHGDTVTNCNLRPVIQAHKERHAKDSSAIMTMLLQPIGGKANLRSTSEDLVIGMDAAQHDSANRILLYEDHRDQRHAAIPCSFFASHCVQLQVRTDLLDVGLDLCSPDVLARFSDEFDYRDIRREFVANSVAEEEEGLQNKLFAHLLAPSEYAARVHSVRTYHAVARDLLRRYGHPTVPENDQHPPTVVVSTTKEQQQQHLQQPPQRYYAMQRHYQYYEMTGRSRVGRSSVVTGPGMMGFNCFVGEHCRIRSTVLGDHCHIADHCTLQDCHLWEGVQVEEGASVSQSVLATGVVVKAGAVVPRGCIIGAGCVIGVGVKLPEYTRLTTCPAAEELDDGFDDDWDDESRSGSEDDEGEGSTDGIETNDLVVETAAPKSQEQIVSDESVVGPDGKGRVWRPPLDDDDDDADSNEENRMPLEESLNSQCIGYNPTKFFSQRNKMQKEDDDSFSLDDGLDKEAALDEEYADRADAVTFGDSPENNNNNNIIGRQEGVDVVKELKIICLEFESATSPIENLAIELNSFKFSQNATYSDCTMAATLAILEKMQIRPDTHSDGKLVQEFKGMLDQWGPLLQKMSIGLDEEKAIVLALERCAVGDIGDDDDEDNDDEASSATTMMRTVLSSGAAFRLLLQVLHNEEIVSEEAILAWAADHDEEVDDSPRGRLFQLPPVQEFLEWLDQESEEDDDDEDSEESGDDN